MELALELVVLCEVELFDNLVVQFPGIENRPHGVRITVIHGKSQKRTHARAAHHTAKRTAHGLLGCRRSDNRSRRIHGINDPHDKHKSDNGRDCNKHGKELEMLQVAIQNAQAKFNKTDRLLLFHKLLVIDVNDERRRDHT